MSTLSNRGARSAETVVRVDLEISLLAQQNQYHPNHNPEGTFPLNIAENKLGWTDLKAKFQEIAANNTIPDWVMGYTDSNGSEEFRTAIAHFYKRYLFDVPVNPAHLACSPGATGIIEMSAFLLADPGEVAAIPAPAYPVYKQDIGNISEIERHDIITHESIGELQDHLILTTEHLEQAKTDIEKKGKQLRIVILTTPDNPTGLTYTEDQMRMATNWCIEQKVHLIVNEIYALSRLNRNQKTIKSFYSFGTLMAEHQSNYLHHWYSFSKDFGISGFRVGIVHTYNEAFIRAYGNTNLSHSVSNHTQWLIQELVSDHKFLDKYILTNQVRLTESYDAVVQLLEVLNISYVKAEGSLFIWLDLSPFLEDQSSEAEHEFWLQLYESTGILLTPGGGFGHVGFGYFRMVYPYVSLPDLTVALSRLEIFIRGLR